MMSFSDRKDTIGLRPFNDCRAGTLAALVVAACACVSCGDGQVEVSEARPTEPAAPRTPPPPSVQARVELQNGLVIETLNGGNSPSATVGDQLTIHYTARAVDGEEELLSTRTGGIPFRFTLGRREVIRGLDRGLLGARAGARIRLTVPSTLAYGAQGLGPVPADTDLTFDVEVIAVECAP